MYALVSGQAGLAVCIRGDSASLIRVDDKTEESGYSVNSVHYLLGGATDVLVLEEPKVNEIHQILFDQWSADRALRLFLIAADGQEPREDISEALECLETMLSAYVSERLMRLLCAAALPPEANLGRASNSASPYNKLSRLLAEVERLQPRICKVRTAWDAIPDELFGGHEDRSDFEKSAISLGVFATLARADEPHTNEAIFETYKLLATQKNSRSVVAAWLKALDLKPAPSIRRQVDEFQEYTVDRQDADKHHSSQTTPYQAFSNVMLQQSAIEAALERGDEAKARRYARELVEKQLRQGEAGFASKSLCRLAQLSKVRGLRSLCLEWTERATQIAPEDGWARAQLGDAYLYYGRLDEAKREFDLAYNLGAQYIALTGRSRILRAKSQFEEALREIRVAKSEFAQDQDAYIAWVHEAEILREMWHLEEALAAYEEAVKLFSQEATVYCGKAAVLAQLGRQSEALSVYNSCIDMLGLNVVAISGKAQVLLQLGLVQDAIVEYQTAIKQFPHESVPRCGLAEVLRVDGRYDDALKAYDEARKEFPYIAVPASGYAEVLKDTQKYDRALLEYNTAIKRFPYDSYLLNGRASALRLMGRYEDSLAAYDEAVAKFPFDLVAACGRALLLKELGRLDDAVSMYDSIVAKRPGFLAARHGKASVLAVQKRYDEALRLLPSGAPRTIDEWIAHHIRCMVLLRTDEFRKAIELFESGALTVPYARQRYYFLSALAVARLKLAQYEKALESVENVSGGTESKVLKLHALAGLGRQADARRVYHELTYKPSPRHIMVLCDEIAACFGLVSRTPQRDQQWLFERECEALLLAA